MGITLIVQIIGACFELTKLNDLNVEREGTDAIFKYGFVLPSNGRSSGGKICSVSVICC